MHRAKKDSQFLCFWPQRAFIMIFSLMLGVVFRGCQRELTKLFTLVEAYHQSHNTSRSRRFLQAANVNPSSIPWSMRVVGVFPQTVDEIHFAMFGNELPDSDQHQSRPKPPSKYILLLLLASPSIPVTCRLRMYCNKRLEKIPNKPGKKVQK